MSVPAVTLTERDGSIGVLPSGEKIAAACGACDGGTAAVPAAYARKQDVIATFTRGPLVDFGCAYIERTGKPILLCKTGNTTAATEDTIDVTGVTGTSVVTYGSDTTANDDYQLYFKVTLGGTIGTGPITVQYSYDDGRTLSPPYSLGTANTFTFPNSGGVGLAFAAGTLVTGDVVRGRTHAPHWNTTEVGAAIAALLASAQPWALLHVVGDIAATDFDAIETAFAATKEHMWVGSVRLPANGESEATYLSSLTSAFGAKATTIGGLCAGACKLAVTSADGTRQLRRGASWPVFCRLAEVSSEVDIAAINLGTLTGTTIRDANGNADEHDEALNPGLDDARFTTLRTVTGISGVYVNNCRIFSAAGSDFEFAQHRRVIAEAEEAVRLYFTHRLSLPVRVNKNTGFILESEALEIESGCNAILRAVLLGKPKASDAFCQLSRTDNLLSTKTLTGQVAVTPLAYPKAINIEIGFRNPALAVIKS